VEVLEAPLEHGAVLFFQDVEAHVDFELGGDAQDVAVIGRVMEVA